VALADKRDTLAGFWVIDEKPTGSKDPYALRRAALGVIRLVLVNGLRLDLDRFFDAQLVRVEAAVNTGMGDAALTELLQEIAEHGVFGAAFHAVRDRLDDLHDDFLALENKVPDTSDDLLRFTHDRLKVHLRDQGIRHDVIDACLALPGSDDLALLVKRAEALAAFLASDDGENLVQGYKRAANILAQAEEKDGVEYRYGADVKYAETAEEKALFAALSQAEAAVAPALASDDFPAAMSAMSALRAPIDAFFDTVQVNADSAILRRNRLNLLHEITASCGKIADLSRIEG
jgi:glycyl-tRNA synthetase beta chain